VPTARRSRTIPVPAAALWEIVRDPHHLPRWWPRVERVEDVDGGAFTEVMRTAKGKVVRADFDVVRADDDARALTWSQRVQGTPFGRILSSSETHLELSRPPGQGGVEAELGAGAGASTHVTIEMRQKLTGFLPHFGSRMVRRAAASTIEEALDGLERLGG